MAKRPTIGENPLDAVMSETPLEAMVPLAELRTGKARPPAMAEPSLEAEKRLQLLEAEVQVLKGEISLLKAKMTEMETHKPRPEPRWVARLRDRLAGK